MRRFSYANGWWWEHTERGAFPARKRASERRPNALDLLPRLDAVDLSSERVPREDWLPGEFQPLKHELDLHISRSDR